MQAIQNVARSLPILLTTTSGSKVTGKTSSDVTVWYRKQDGTVYLNLGSLTGIFTEVGLGVYEIDFAGTYFDVLGQFFYTCTCLNCVDYDGVIDVVVEPAKESTVGNIGTAGGAALNIDVHTDNSAGGISGVTSTTTIVGTPTGTFANTSNINQIYHTITGTATAADIVYQFTCGGGTSPVEAIWVGRINSNNDVLTVAAWRHDTNAWENLRTIDGVNTTVDSTNNITLYARHMGTSAAELGKVYIRLYCTGMTSPVIYTDQIKVSYSITSRSVSYAGGAIWIDTEHGTAGTEVFVNGTADNPVLTYADALVLSTALRINKFEIVNGSTVTATGPTNNLTDNTMLGNNWTLVLANSVDITNAYIEGADVSGSCTGINSHFQKCSVGSITLNNSLVSDCTLTGAITLISNGTYTFRNCNDGSPVGLTAPTLIFASNASVGMRNYRGGIQINTMETTDALRLDGAGRLLVDSSCTGGDIIVRGFFTVTNNAGAEWTPTTGFTLSDTARYAEDQNITNVTGKVLGGGSATITGVGAMVEVTLTQNDLDTIIAGIIAGMAGSGNIEWTHTVTVNNTPFAGATVSYYSDVSYTVLAASGTTNVAGQVTFMLVAGTYYIKVYIPGNPVTYDVEVVA